MSFLNSKEPFQFKTKTPQKKDSEKDLNESYSPDPIVVPDDVNPDHILASKARPAACVFVASLVNGVPPQAHKSALEDLFGKWSTDPIEVKVLVDNRNRPYAFVQYTTEKEAKRAIKNAQGALLNNRPIRCEQARVNRTLFFSPKFQDIGPTSDELKTYLNTFGEIEEFLLAPEATRLPNADEFKQNEWFVRFVHRDDAISAYTDAVLKKNWDITWSQNIDSTLDITKLDFRSISVENLDWKFSDGTLRLKFEKYGVIRSFAVYRPETKPDSLAYAYIKYFDEKSAEEAVNQENGSSFLNHKLVVKVRKLVESFAVDDNIKTSDIRVPAASPPLIPLVQGAYNRRHASTPNKGNHKRQQVPRSHSEQNFTFGNASPRSQYGSIYEGYCQPGGYFGMQGPIKAHLLPTPRNSISASQIYPGLHDMNALYQQQYLMGVNGFYTPQRPRLSQSGRGQKGAMYMTNSDYSGYGYSNYVVYPSVIGPYMAGPTGIYPTLDYIVPRQFESTFTDSHESSGSPKPKNSIPSLKQRSKSVSSIMP